MADEEQLKLLKQGVEVWNKWRFSNQNVVIDLSRTNLSRTNLLNANLSGADLSGANLGLRFISDNKYK